jgi:hypothetical protein
MEKKMSHNLGDNFTDDRYTKFDRIGKAVTARFAREYWRYSVEGEGLEWYRKGDLIASKDEDTLILEAECRPNSFDGHDFKHWTVNVPFRKLHGGDKWDRYFTIDLGEADWEKLLPLSVKLKKLEDRFRNNEVMDQRPNVKLLEYYEDLKNEFYDIINNTKQINIGMHFPKVYWKQQPITTNHRGTFIAVERGLVEFYNTGNGVFAPTPSKILV